MAWLFEKSATWRRIVSITKQSPLAMAGFTATCFVGTYALGEVVMGATNPELQSQKEKPLRSQESMHNKAMARVNRERLAVLLEETRKGSSNDRYAASLRGESMGTHKGGTTLGARGMRENSAAEVKR